MKQYIDFELYVTPTGTGSYRVTAVSPVGETSGTFQMPRDDDKLQIFLLEIGRPRRVRQRGYLPESLEKAQTFGKDLYESLFRENLRDLLFDTRQDAERQDAGVRLRLRLNDSPDLTHVPWEFLCDGDEFLVLSDNWSIVRHPDVPRPMRRREVNWPLRILVTVSSPHDLPPLDVEGEMQRLDEALGKLERRELVTISQTSGASLGALEHELRRAYYQERPYHIWHYIGHGDYDPASQNSRLALTTPEGLLKMVSGFELGVMLNNYSKHLGLVLLNACQGARSGKEDPFAGVAAALIKHNIPAVIAMQFEISDRAAKVFAGEFYTALVEGLPLETAVSNARRKVMYGETKTEFATPVLFMHSKEAQVFVLPASIPAQDEDERRQTPAETTDLENKENLQKLYTQGLGHFYLKRWRLAIDALEGVAHLQTDFPLAADFLEKARKELRQEELLTQARKAVEQENWNAAVQALEGLLSENPALPEALEMLATAKPNLEKANLYAQAELLYEAGQWEAVLQVFEHLEALDAQYADPKDLRQSARNTLDRLEVERKVQALLESALLNMSKKNWQAACDEFDQALALRPEDPDLQALLNEAQAERITQEKEHRLKGLYAKCSRAAKRGDWASVVQHGGEILDEQSDYRDAATLVENARQELNKLEAAREEEANRKQAEELRGKVLYQIDQGNWQQARNLLEQIQAVYSSMADLESLTAQVDDGLEKQEQEKQQLERKKKGLYQKLSEAMRDEDWESAIQQGEALLEEDAQYQDAASLVQQARAAWEQDHQAAQEEQRRLLLQRQRSRYSQMNQAEDSRDWERVILLGERILSELPDYRDTASRVKAAREALSAAQSPTVKKTTPGKKKPASRTSSQKEKTSQKTASSKSPASDQTGGNLPRLYKRGEKHTEWKRQAGAIQAYYQVQASDPNFRDVRKKLENARVAHMDSLVKDTSSYLLRGSAISELERYGMEAASRLIVLYRGESATRTSKYEGHLVKLGAPIAPLLISLIRLSLERSGSSLGTSPSLSLRRPYTVRTTSTVGEVLKLTRLLEKVADQSHTQSIADLLKFARERVVEENQEKKSIQGSTLYGRRLLNDRNTEFDRRIQGLSKRRDLSSSRVTSSRPSYLRSSYQITAPTWEDVATSLAKALQASKNRTETRKKAAPVYYPAVAPACLLDEAHKEVTGEEGFTGFRDYLRKRNWDISFKEEKPLNQENLQAKYVMIIGGPQSPLLFGRGAERWEEKEVDLVERFVKEGGGLLVLGNAGGNIEHLNALCRRFGITFLEEAVYEGKPAISADHPVMEGGGNMMLLRPGGKGGHLMQSAADKGLATLGARGGVLAAAAEVGLGRVVALASVDAISDACLSANQKLLDNIFTWLLAECAPKWN